MNSVERVKKICKEKRIPISHLEKDLGYANGYISQLKKGTFPADRLMEIAEYLQVSASYLLNGDTDLPLLNTRDEKDIERRLQETLSCLELQQDGLMFSGEPLDDETRELLNISLENSLRIAKVNAKQKFTPKKYR